MNLREKTKMVRLVFYNRLLMSIHFYFQVTSPYGNNLHQQENVTHGQFAFTSQESGNYLACFWVTSHSSPSGDVNINIDWKIGIAAKDWDSVAKIEKIEVCTLL